MGVNFFREDIEELIEKGDYPSCGECGAEFTEIEDIEKLEYSRTTSTADHYYCTCCGKEGINIVSEEKIF